MALINIGRFRDVLVRSGVADDAPALEVSVGLDEVIEEALEPFATSESLDGKFDVLRAELRDLRNEMRLLFAEQEARHQKQLNQLTATMLGGAALIAAVTGVLVAVFG